MKVLLSIIASLVFSSGVASASGVDLCSHDNATSAKIKKIDLKNLLILSNPNSEMVGAIEYSPESKELSALYLCGNNSGYYYIDNATTADWLDTLGNTHAIGTIYNDEYEVEATAKTLYVGTKASKIEITVNVKFTGDPKAADYAPFTASFYADFPSK